MLKKLTLIICLSIFTASVKADDGQKVESKVQKVTVFLNGAQVTRTATVNVAVGTSTLIFDNISSDIDEQSLQLNASGEFTILSIKNELVYLNKQDKENELSALQALQKGVRAKIEFQNALLAINKQEEEMLMKNQMIAGQNSSPDIVKLRLALNFQTERLTEIKKRTIAINEQIAALVSEFEKYEQQIEKINAGNNKTVTNVFVTVSSNAPVVSTFTLSYLVRNAGWYPSYDVYAKNISSPISIAYKANVRQRSGEDWRNVKLKLSTGNPSVSGIKPVLNPYYLGLTKVEDRVGYQTTQLNEVVVVGYGVNMNKALADRIPGLNTSPLAVQQIENQTNVEFSIDAPFSVPTDGKQYLVEVNRVELPATYQYYTAPKLSTDVFLTASLTNWNKYNFLSGEANLLFEGTFIGKSSINTRVSTDTLNLSLGVDKNIVVTRTLQKELTEKQSLGANKKETKNWLINIKNRKNQKVNLLVEDQVPVSQNSGIEVDTQDLSAGTLDKTTGKISWNLTLNSQAEKKLELKYQVKYPKNQQVIVQ
ncbi:DUF4139 domain-containing protein [Mucilaginibacter calamicampi]|uniref:DUF4139 domain-containing protein n=1 Tax=Mucilaginibacter calamicampi TaxID=1302352 RepID=A0ABW2YV30_9SPHI